MNIINKGNLFLNKVSHLDKPEQASKQITKTPNEKKENAKIYKK